jgi:hypothetical protein
MTKVLLLNTDYTGEVKSCKVKDGKIILKDKEFIIDKTIPISVKKRLGKEDIYICKWDCLVGAEYKLNETEIERDKLIEELKKDGFNDKEIQKVINEINEYELENKLKIKKFVYKKLVPTQPIWIKTAYPEILKETGKIRFIKSLSKYSSGFGFDIGKIAILFIVAFVFLTFFIYILTGGKFK